MAGISVITVTKGNPDGFARTRASVEAQDFTDFEWIVIDGNAEADDGIYDAMNKGIARARGDFMVFMNAGDGFADDGVLGRIAFAVAQARDAHLFYGDAIEAGFSKPARHDMRYGMVTHHQAMVFRRGVVRYDTRYPIAADYKFMLATAARGRAVYMPFHVCVFEQGGISQRRTAQGRREQAAIRREMGVRAPFAGILQCAAMALRRMAPRLYWLSRSRLRTARA